MSELEKKVFEIVARVTRKDVASIKPELQLVADLSIDSPKSLELLCALEDELKIEIHEDAVSKINTVGDILTLVTGQVEC